MSIFNFLIFYKFLCIVFIHLMIRLAQHGCWGVFDDLHYTVYNGAVHWGWGNVYGIPCPKGRLYMVSPGTMYRPGSRRKIQIIETQPQISVYLYKSITKFRLSSFLALSKGVRPSRAFMFLFAPYWRRS